MFEGWRVDTTASLMMVLCLGKEISECSFSVLFKAVLDIVALFLLFFFKSIDVVLHLGLLAIYVV